jgi:phytoene desaturase
MNKKRNIAIIGAGIGGLSSACLMAAKGYKVTVFEKNKRVGGKMNLFQSDGFTFDTGPSLLTMPHILERLFSECGYKLAEHLKLIPLSPVCRYFYQDGKSFDCFDNRGLTVSEIRNIAPEDAEAYSSFLDYSEDLYRKTEQAFIYNPLFDLSDFKDLDLLSFLGIDAFNTVSSRVDSYFKSPYLRKFFKRFTTYNGSSPYQAPATLNVIPHVELNQGGFYVDGGIYKIAETLFWMAQNLGVNFKFDTTIESISVNNGAVSGISAGSDYFDSDLVIANSDATETIVHLIDSDKISARQRKKAEQIEPSCSGFVLLLGIDRKYDQLKHHNIFFSDDYRSEFDQIFDLKKMPEDPTIYVANTSVSNPAHAPEGGSNLFILVNAPYLSDQYNWDIHADEYENKVISELQKRGLEDLREHIKVKERITPRDFYDRYLSNKGSIYGTSSNSKFSAFLRPRNKSREINGLYFVGGSTHPGGGIPLVVQSALNAAELIDRYEF